MKRQVKKNIQKAQGAQGFGPNYWDSNYGEPETMDGIGNRDDHVQYMKSVFQLEQIDISSIIDLGFGRAELFTAVLKAFLPYRAHGIEPSRFIFSKANPRKMSPVNSTKLKLECIDLVSWCQHQTTLKRPKWFDLAICNSVFQYLHEDELKCSIPIISKQVKYLYLTVPTDVELERQKEELKFIDTFAFKRSRDFYIKLLAPYFTFTSSRILESRYHFDENSTFFSDLLFRF